MPPLMFHVERAVARGGQVVRVVFSAEPKHKSASALDDGLNPANYAIAVVSGEAQVPHSVGVYQALVTFPAFGLFAATEFALDVQLDRPVVVGLGYSVTANPGLVSALHLAIGAPFSAPFVGAAVPTRSRQERRQPTMVDFLTVPFMPGIVVDSSGDWACHSGIDATRKRCLRRVLTQKNSFASLPGYGLAIDVKAPMTTARLTGVRADIAQQVKQEPDVVQAQSAVEMNALGYLRVDLKVRTADNQEITPSILAGPEGVSAT